MQSASPIQLSRRLRISNSLTVTFPPHGQPQPSRSHEVPKSYLSPPRSTRPSLREIYPAVSLKTSSVQNQPTLSRVVRSTSLTLIRCFGIRLVPKLLSQTRLTMHATSSSSDLIYITFLIKVVLSCCLKKAYGLSTSSSVCQRES